MKKISVVFTFLMCLTCVCTAQELQYFSLQDVRLSEGPFKEAQQTDLEYILSLDPDRLLAPFLKDAGLKPKADNYGNWENTGLDGHIGGHYLSALSLMYASTGNEAVKQRLDYMLNELQRCQKHNGNGYFSGVPGGKKMWEEIAEGKINANAFGLNDKWVPLYNIHKTFAGLYDAWTIAGSLQAKDMLLQLSDWFMDVCAPLSDEQLQKMLASEHGGINEVFANLSAQTGEHKYLDFAERFSHQHLLAPLSRHQDQLNGMHANTQIPKVIGFERIGELNGDASWTGAAEFFWQTVVNKRSVSIGGNSVREHFNPTNDFSSVMESREGPETCNSYNMLKLTKYLFAKEPSSGYIDYYERTLYNHILSSQHPEGGFVYFTPMRPGHYRVYSRPQEGFWCCVGSGLENHGKYGELIYAHQQQDLLVNLFIPSVLNWKEKGLKLVQETEFPNSETSNLKLTLKKPSVFSLRIRYPQWAKKGGMKVAVNAKTQGEIQPDADGYINLKRRWKSGDVVTLILPMHTEAETLPDGSDWVSFVHGPVVLAAKLSEDKLAGLRADAGRMSHIAGGPLMPLQEIPLFVGNPDDMAKQVKAAGTAESLNFKAPKAIVQDRYKDLELVPFASIHDARYAIYFPYTTADKLAEKEKQLREWEAANAKREAETLDVVNCGEQQPESDHAFKGENTKSGIFKDRHYRNAEGWFSYRMNNKNGEAKRLEITCHGKDKGKRFSIHVDGQKLTEVNLSATSVDDFVKLNYELPDSLMNGKAEQIEVRFVADEGSAVANIYEVRLLR